MTSHPEATSGLLATAASVSDESPTSSVSAHDAGDDDGVGRKRRRRGEEGGLASSNRTLALLLQKIGSN